MGLHFLLGAGPCHAPLVFHGAARVAKNPGTSALKGPCRSPSSQCSGSFFVSFLRVLGTFTEPLWAKMWTPNVQVAMETDLLHPSCLAHRRCSIKSAAPVTHLVIYQVFEPLPPSRPKRFPVPREFTGLEPLFLGSLRTVV